MLDLDVVKSHCRIEPDFTDDDALIAIYSGAAARYVETWTRRKLYESEENPGYQEDEDAILLTDDVTAAMLLLISHWYENRAAVTESSSQTTLPFAVTALLQPYKIYGL